MGKLTGLLKPFSAIEYNGVLMTEMVRICQAVHFDALGPQEFTDAEGHLQPPGPVGYLDHRGLVAAGWQGWLVVAR